MADTTTLRARLAELETAKHAVLTGCSHVAVSHDGKSVTYNKANLAELNAAIAEIKSQLGLGRRRAIGVRF